MAIVLPQRKLIVVPMPTQESYEVLNKCFVTHTLTLVDGDVLILPHHEDSVKLLRNLDIAVDGCDIFDCYYEPPTVGGKPLWWWQYETAKFLYNNQYAFVTSTPRTGKTLATVVATDAVQKKVGGAALIVTPLSVAEWETTIAEWFPYKKVQHIHRDRIKDLDTPADYYVINPAGLKVIKDELIAAATRGKFSVFVVDELTEFANPKSQRWKAAQEISDLITYRWGLTGTPGKPEKIYGQVKLINPRKVPFPMYRWRDMTMYKINNFKWLPKLGHEGTVKEAMSPCIRFDKDELMEIPTPQVLHEDVPLSPAQEKMTQELVENLKVLIDNDEVNATTASTIAQKLLQVAGGVVRSTTGTPIHLDATPKLDRLDELLRRTPRKKVVYSSFTAINDMLTSHIREQGFTCEKIDGSVTGLKRKRILKEFLEEDTPHVLVCHPQTTAYGVELASADMIICYGTPMSGAFMYQQLFERLSSTRQTAEETFVVHLAAGRQDKVSFAALESGVSVERNIVSIFTRSIAEWE